MARIIQRLQAQGNASPNTLFSSSNSNLAEECGVSERRPSSPPIQQTPSGEQSRRRRAFRDASAADTALVVSAVSPQELGPPPGLKLPVLKVHSSTTEISSPVVCGALSSSAAVSRIGSREDELTQWQDVGSTTAVEVVRLNYGSPTVENSNLSSSPLVAEDGQGVASRTPTATDPPLMVSLSTDDKPLTSFVQSPQPPSVRDRDRRPSIRQLTSAVRPQEVVVTEGIQRQGSIVINSLENSVANSVTNSLKIKQADSGAASSSIMNDALKTLLVQQGTTATDRTGSPA